MIRVECPLLDPAEMGFVYYNDFQIGVIRWSKIGYMSVTVEVLLGISGNYNIAVKIANLVESAFKQKYKVQEIVVKNKDNEILFSKK